MKIKTPSWVRESGMTGSALKFSAAYFVFMIACIAVVLYFRLIPWNQMGIRLDTLPLGILVGVLCQVPLQLLSILRLKNRATFTEERRKQIEEIAKHARTHGMSGAFDAPVAELFWSGIVLSSIVVFLAYVGLPSLVAGLLGVIVGTGLHVLSHLLPPLRHLVGEKWWEFYLVMALNRLAFIISGNIVAPIIGHVLLSWIPLLMYRATGVTDRIL